MRRIPMAAERVSRGFDPIHQSRSASYTPTLVFREPFFWTTGTKCLRDDFWVMSNKSCPVKGRFLCSGRKYAGSGRVVFPHSPRTRLPGLHESTGWHRVGFNRPDRKGRVYIAGTFRKAVYGYDLSGRPLSRSDQVSCSGDEWWALWTNRNRV